MSPWTISAVLDWTREHFTKKGLDSPRLDAELLLCHVLKKPRLYLYTHFDQPLSQPERDAYRALVQRRGAREPVSLILGEREFYGRTFTVTRDVLSPRPETEHLVDMVREWVEGRDLKAPRILDVGTGSGAIAVSLAAQYPQAQVVATDLSSAALAVARQNAAKHSVTIDFREGDLLAPVDGRFDVIASNPPYVATADDLMPEVKLHEPALALFGGADGLEVIRKLVARVFDHLASPGLLVMEIGAGQWPRVRALMEPLGFARLTCVRDLGGIDRVIVAER